jgi:hypothetical protein
MQPAGNRRVDLLVSEQRKEAADYLPELVTANEVLPRL